MGESSMFSIKLWAKLRNSGDKNVNDYYCPICHNTGYFESRRQIVCSFCNGTCGYTKAAERFLKIHPCQCFHSDRENCPVCGEKCHHGTNNRPRLLKVQPPK
jgi:hypothetical protein